MFAGGGGGAGGGGAKGGGPTSGNGTFLSLVLLGSVSVIKVSEIGSVTSDSVYKSCK